MTLVVTFITYIIILSANVGADKNIAYAVKESEVVNKEITYADFGVLIRAELCHFSHMQQKSSK